VLTSQLTSSGPGAGNTCKWTVATPGQKSCRASNAFRGRKRGGRKMSVCSALPSHHEQRLKWRHHLEELFPQGVDVAGRSDGRSLLGPGV
jgi:hypothetical protein